MCVIAIVQLKVFNPYSVGQLSDRNTNMIFFISGFFSFLKWEHLIYGTPDAQLSTVHFFSGQLRHLHKIKLVQKITFQVITRACVWGGRGLGTTSWLHSCITRIPGKSTFISEARPKLFFIHPDCCVRRNRQNFMRTRYSFMISNFFFGWLGKSIKLSFTVLFELSKLKIIWIFRDSGELAQIT